MKTNYPLVITFLILYQIALGQCIKGDCENGFGVFREGAVTTVRDFSGKFPGWWVEDKETGTIAMQWQAVQIARYADGAFEMGYFKQSADTMGTSALYNGLGFEEGRMYKVEDFKKSYVDADLKSNKCLSGDCYNGPGANFYYGGGQYDNLITYGTYENGKTINDYASIVVNSTFTSGHFSVSDVPKSRSDADLAQIISCSYNVEEEKVTFGKGLFADEIFSYKIEDTPTPAQTQVVNNNVTATDTKTTYATEKPRKSFWRALGKFAEGVAAVGLAAGEVYIDAANAQSKSTPQKTTQTSYSGGSGSTSSLPPLAKGESLIWEDQGVRASYRYSYKKTGINNSGREVSEWSLTVYLRNYSGRKISIGNMSVSFIRFSRLNLPAGWAYLESYNPKFSSYYVNDKSAVTWQQNLVQTFGNGEPAAPTVNGGFRFEN